MVAPAAWNGLVAAITRHIRDEGLRSGDRLPRERLAVLLGAPSSRIVKALAMLERAGLVYSQPRRGYRVV